MKWLGSSLSALGLDNVLDLLFQSKHLMLNNIPN